jgi:transcription elongation factor Elf1
MSEPATAPSGPPRCPKCRSRPTVQSVVPIRTGFKYVTLRCTTCGLVYDAQMHTDPMMSDGGGWIDSELISPSKSAAVGEAEKAINRAAS